MRRVYIYLWIVVPAVLFGACKNIDESSLPATTPEVSTVYYWLPSLLDPPNVPTSNLRGIVKIQDRFYITGTMNLLMIAPGKETPKFIIAPGKGIEELPLGVRHNALMSLASNSAGTAVFLGDLYSNIIKFDLTKKKMEWKESLLSQSGINGGIVRAETDTLYASRKTSLGTSLYRITGLNKLSPDKKELKALKITTPSGLFMSNQKVLYVIGDNGTVIYKIEDPDGALPGVSILAGEQGTSEYKDGRGRQAWFKGISSLTGDNKGNLYTADGKSNRRALRKIRISDGMVTTIAGDPDQTTTQMMDGPGSRARFVNIKGLFYSGSDSALYAVDDYGLRKISGL